MVKLASCFILFFLSTYALCAQVLFCYEDKSLPPLFTGNGLDVPKENPGASIEILQQVSKHAPEVTFSFVRRPWKRCLSDIKNNKVDAVIASYRESRASYLVFPKKDDGQIDEQYAISYFGSCLIGNEKRLRRSQEYNDFVVAAPSGYAIVQTLYDRELLVLTTYSQHEAYELVLKGVVDATVGICELGKDKVSGFLYSDRLVAKYPAIEVTHGYIAFSKGFEQTEPNTVRLVWQTQLKIQSTPLYLKYIMRDLKEH